MRKRCAPQESLFRILVGRAIAFGDVGVRSLKIGGVVSDRCLGISWECGRLKLGGCVR
ncbi:hypothetical protein [Anabaena sp. PCC 7108]|uniref:hypothetical protein n=1 Tax=Anabaena sp. PCC 7108 TaxID=163908 RepID=UPI00130D84F0|nr:hypothetical protein [Anabaena sp. PCC 7108]